MTARSVRRCRELTSAFGGFESGAGQLKNIDDDQRDVILLADRRGLPLAEFEKQLLQQLRSWL
jgi:hypothetical protein